MPGRTTKYRKDQTAIWEGEIMMILANSEEAMTIDMIKNSSITLTGITSQKMACILGHLIEMGLVKKGKSKSLGRMMYKAVAVMEEQGYEIEEDEY